MVLIGYDCSIFEIMSTPDDAREFAASGNRVLAFMADWCMPCRMQIGELLTDPKGIKDFLKKHDIKLGYCDVEDRDLGVFAREEYDVSNMPVWAFHDQGHHRQSIVGLQPRKYLTDLMEKLYAPAACAAGKQ